MKKAGREDRTRETAAGDRLSLTPPALRMEEGPMGQRTQGPLNAGRVKDRILPWSLREETEACPHDVSPGSLFGHLTSRHCKITDLCCFKSLDQW